MTTEAESRDARRRRIVVVTLVVGVTAIGVALTVRWVRRGGVRHAVRDLAEEGAVALADRLVDEIFPAA
jgi:hypothetical protein